MKTVFADIDWLLPIDGYVRPFKLWRDTIA